MAEFNVKTDFLAAGDGVTVDSAAFNNAVTALNAAGGGTLLVPAGTYVISDVRLGSNITVCGAGRARPCSSWTRPPRRERWSAGSPRPAASPPPPTWCCVT